MIKHLFDEHKPQIVTQISFIAFARKNALQFGIFVVWSCLNGSYLHRWGMCVDVFGSHYVLLLHIWFQIRKCFTSNLNLKMMTTYKRNVL